MVAETGATTAEMVKRMLEIFMVERLKKGFGTIGREILYDYCCRLIAR
jgi:hypothetical protein